jgi:hypothetical protein
MTKTIILPVVLYGCETWSLTLRQEYGLKIIQNRALRRIFGPTRDEMVRGWKKLHNDERRLHTMKRVRIAEKKCWCQHDAKCHS